jgi:hypothetical protein
VMSNPQLAVGNPITIPVNNQPVQICPPVSGPVLIYNADITNIAYVGYGDSIAQTNSGVVQPLAYTIMDGSRAIWGFCPTATVYLNIIPGGISQSASPAQIAAQISALGLATLVEQINQNTAIPTNISTTGVPLLNLYTFLQGKAQTIGAGGSLVLGPYTIDQIGYEFFIQLGTTQNVATAPVNIVFQWTDSSSGLVTATQVYNMYAAYTGGAGPTHNVEGHGPSNADTLTITITATSGAIQIACAILETSRVFGRHDWRTQNPASVTVTFPTMTYISCVPAANILAAQVSPSLNNSSIEYLLPFYTGTAILWGGIAVDTNAGVFDLVDLLSTLSSTLVARYKVGSSSFGNLGDVAPTPISFPRDQCLLNMINGTATASTMTAGIIAQELETN